ncbi:hypothetical protein ABPG72_017202 [Tetrahymena utriculariae]
MSQRLSYKANNQIKNTQQCKDDKYEVLKYKIKNSLVRLRVNPLYQDLSIYNIKNLEGYSKFYKSELMLDSISKISLKYKIWLGIRGDGNCFYRSIIILYFLELFNSNDFKEVDTFITRVKSMKNIKINSIEDEPDTEMLQYILICFLYHLKNMKQQQKIVDMEYIIEQYNSRPEVDLAAIVICRNLIFKSFQIHQNHPNFSFFIEEQMKSQIPEMLLKYYEYAEDIIIPLASQAFRCNLLVQNLYRQSQTSINTEQLLYQPFDQRLPIFTTLNVLFTKGHYESLITKDQANSLEQFYKIKREILYRTRINNYEFYSEIIDDLKKLEEDQLSNKVETQSQKSIEPNPNDRDYTAQQTKQVVIDNFIITQEDQKFSCSSKETCQKQKNDDEEFKKQENSNQIIQKQCSQRELESNLQQQEKQQYKAQKQGQFEQNSTTNLQKQQYDLLNKQNNEENYQTSTEGGTPSMRQNSKVYYPSQGYSNKNQIMNNNFMESSQQTSVEQNDKLIKNQEQQNVQKQLINDQQKQIMDEESKSLQKKQQFKYNQTEQKQADLEQSAKTNQKKEQYDILNKQNNEQIYETLTEEGKPSIRQNSKIYSSSKRMQNQTQIMDNNFMESSQQRNLEQNDKPIKEYEQQNIQKQQINDQQKQIMDEERKSVQIKQKFENDQTENINSAGQFPQQNSQPTQINDKQELLKQQIIDQQKQITNEKSKIIQAKEQYVQNQAQDQNNVEKLLLQNSKSTNIQKQQEILKGQMNTQLKKTQNEETKNIAQFKQDQRENKNLIEKNQILEKQNLQTQIQTNEQLQYGLIKSQNIFEKSPQLQQSDKQINGESSKNNEYKNQKNTLFQDIKCEKCKNKIDINKSINITKQKIQQNKGGFLCQNCLKQNKNSSLYSQNQKQERQEDELNMGALQNKEVINQQFQNEDDGKKIQQKQLELKQDSQNNFSQSKIIKKESENSKQNKQTENKFQQQQQQIFDDNFSIQQKQLQISNFQEKIIMAPVASEQKNQQSQKSINNELNLNNKDLNLSVEGNDDSKQIKEKNKYQNQISNLDKQIKRPQPPSIQTQDLQSQNLALKNQFQDRQKNQQELITKNIKVEENKQSSLTNLAQNINKNNSINLKLCILCQNKIENNQKYVLQLQNTDNFRWICFNCVNKKLKQDKIIKQCIIIEGETYLMNESLQKEINLIFPQLANIQNQIQQNDNYEVDSIAQSTQLKKETKKFTTNQCLECQEIAQTIQKMHQVKFIFADDKTKKEQDCFLCQSCLSLLITKDQDGKNIIESNSDQKILYIVDQYVKKKIEFWQQLSYKLFSKSKQTNQNIKKKQENEKQYDEEEEKINQITSNENQPINVFDYKIDKLNQAKNKAQDKNHENVYQANQEVFPNNNVTPDKLDLKDSVQNKQTQESNLCEGCNNSLVEEKLIYETEVIQGKINLKVMLCSECFQQILIQKGSLSKDTIITFKQKQYQINVKTYKQQQMIFEKFLENQIKESNQLLNQQNQEKSVRFLSSNESIKNKETQYSKIQIQSRCENCQQIIDQEENKCDILILEVDSDIKKITKEQQIEQKLLEGKEKQKQQLQKQTNPSNYNSHQSKNDQFQDNPNQKRISQQATSLRNQNYNLLNYTPYQSKNELSYDNTNYKRISQQVTSPKNQNQNSYQNKNALFQDISQQATSPKNQNNNLQRKNYFEQPTKRYDYIEKTQQYDIFKGEEEIIKQIKRKNELTYYAQQRFQSQDPKIMQSYARSNQVTQGSQYSQKDQTLNSIFGKKLSVVQVIVLSIVMTIVLTIVTKIIQMLLSRKKLAKIGLVIIFLFCLFCYYSILFVIAGYEAQDANMWIISYLATFILNEFIIGLLISVGMYYGCKKKISKVNIAVLELLGASQLLQTFKS